MVKHRELKPGKIITQDNETFTLIRYDPSWRGDPLPWIDASEIDDEDEFFINESSKRWLVELPDGFKTHRYIRYMHSKNLIIENNEYI
jgi:hypothetical protein